ncbi:TPA: hypothetical protein JIR14_20200 [Acinetobacter baumannii]|nr:hypothetical protein [Acinetobacter baumannii]HAV4467255.1 hypothetical protein [Acinetobacter baumannii]
MYDVSGDAFRFIETNTEVIIQEVRMNRPVGTVTPPQEVNVRKSRFSFSSKQAKDLGDSMMNHYLDLAQKTSKTK